MKIEVDSYVRYSLVSIQLKRTFKTKLATLRLFPTESIRTNIWLKSMVG
jgi:hypothetical protein